jgi:hypothetical protein
MNFAILAKYGGNSGGVWHDSAIVDVSNEYETS